MGKKPYFAQYDESATWFTDLRPAFGENKFFFEDELKEMLSIKEDKYAYLVA